MNAYGFFLYGLFGGFPFYFSGGMDTLRGKFRALGIECPQTFQYTEWRAIVAAIMALPTDAIVFVIGHSFGANAVTWILAELYRQQPKRKVAYVAGYDPSITTLLQQPVALPPNVRFALSIRGTGMSIPGHGELNLTLDNRYTSLVKLTDADGHTDIDDLAGLHGRSLATARTVLSKPYLIAA